MRTALLSLMLAAFAAWPALAEPCAETEAQLVSVSEKLKHGDIAAAERVLSPIETSDPDCPEAVLSRARIQATKGDASGAEDNFIRYNNFGLGNSRAYSYYARFLIDEREYQRADALANLAIRQDPDDPVALVVQGQILAMKGRSREAIDLLEKASTLDPTNAEARFQLGGIHDRAKRPIEAVKNFEKEVAIDPFDARGWDYLGLNLEPLGEVDQAEKAYRQGLQVNRPGHHFDAFLDLNFGRFLMKRNLLQESMQHLNRAIELVPQVRAPWYERARLNLRLKDYARARIDAEKAADIEDHEGAILDLQVYALLEQIYIRLGETTLAGKYAELGRLTAVPAQSQR